MLLVQLNSPVISQKKLYLRKDGQPNLSYKENSVGFTNNQGERLEKDGTPRFKASKTKCDIIYCSLQYAACPA